MRYRLAGLPSPDFPAGFPGRISLAGLTWPISPGATILAHSFDTARCIFAGVAHAPVPKRSINQDRNKAIAVSPKASG